MELTKAIIGIVSIGAVVYGFYCLYKTKQALEIMSNTIEAATNDLEQLSNDYHGHEHD
tara:strand:+ start:292 stop:465 length:174 start_codon:yes stop_codon:yes gene_type:complete